MDKMTGDRLSDETENSATEILGRSERRHSEAPDDSVPMAKTTRAEMDQRWKDSVETKLQQRRRSGETRQNEERIGGGALGFRRRERMHTV